MLFLDIGHNPWLVATSFIVALVAGATGLTLTKDLSHKTVLQKKLAVALASIALGGGIWSMHFVGMLGLQLPILFYYDAAITLVSALIAILMVAIALLILHFRARTTGTIVFAGIIVGLGILAMHYVGMAGMQMCSAVYTVTGVIGASILSILFCVLAFSVAYSKRTNRSILTGALCFGVAVFAVHFLAMSGTNFVAVSDVVEFGPSISNEALAIGVILSSFVLFGGFLWVGSTFIGSVPVETPQPITPIVPSTQGRIPCEREGAKVFIAPQDVLFVRADGHYTQVYSGDTSYFCSWPITEATKRLLQGGFVKVHRSYLVNPAKVAQFERGKDKGRIRFGVEGVPPVPVSRSHLKDTIDALA